MLRAQLAQTHGRTDKRTDGRFDFIMHPKQKFSGHNNVALHANRLEPRSGSIYVGPDLGSRLFAILYKKKRRISFPYRVYQKKSTIGVVIRINQNLMLSDNMSPSCLSYDSHKHLAFCDSFIKHVCITTLGYISVRQT